MKSYHLFFYKERERERERDVNWIKKKLNEEMYKTSTPTLDF